MHNIEKMMEHSEIGYARQKMIYNAEGKAVDYSFLAVNSAFERLTGLKKKEILNRRVTEVLPKIADDDFEWIGYYGKIAAEGGKSVFEQYSAPLKKCYRVEAFSCEKDYFTTLFTDVSHERELVEASKAFLDDEEEVNTYKQITQRMQRITGAHYVALNIFLEEGGRFMTAAIAGVSSTLQKAAQLLGFNPLKKEWPPDQRRLDLIKGKRVTVFDHLHELTGNVISKRVIQLVEKTFNLGKTVIIKSAQGERIIGDFTLMFSKDNQLQNETEAVIYADMVGMLIEKRNSQRELLENKQQLDTIISNTPAVIYTYRIENQGHSHITFINENVKKVLGFEPTDFTDSPGLWSSCVHPEDIPKLQKKLAGKNMINQYRFRDKEGQYHWLLDKQRVLKKDSGFVEIIGTWWDITDQKRLELEVGKRELKFRSLFETMAQGVVYHDTAGRIITANPAAERILGLSLAQMHDLTSADPKWRTIDEDGQPFPGEEHPAMVALRTGQSVYGKIMGVYNQAEEKYRWIKVNAIPQYREGEKEPYQVHATFEDITKEIEAHLALKESQNQLKTTLQETNKQKNHLEAMHEIAVDVLNSTDFLETATKLFNDCKKQTGATSGYVALLNDAGDENEVLYLDSGGDNCTVDPALPMPIRGLRGIVFQSGEVEYHNEFMHSKHWQYMPKGHVGLNNVLFAPLKNQGKVIGLLGLGNKEGGFTDEDANTAKTIAKFVSIALQKSQLVSQLTQEREKAEKANRAKSEFLANVNHELRTQLNGILGFSDILGKTPLNKEQSEYVSIVHTSGKHLADIITDILDFSRIEAGKFELHPEKTNLKGLVEKTLSILRYKAEAKGLTLSASFGNNVPQMVEVDGSRLSQILLNLVSNAVKFTEAGSVQLSVNQKDRQHDNALLLFKVSDTGMGIKEKDQERIFEPFHQTEMSSSKRAEGTGLGLTISKEMLEKMGGVLKFKSTYGKGSTFYFDLLLPCEGEQPTNDDQAVSEVSTEDSAFKNKKVLIAEDNSINMNYAKTAISLFSKDIQIIKAKDGKEAYDLYLIHSPDLILMDIIMPKVDGYHATAMIRRHNQQIPIIAMTAKALEEDREDCLAAGMNDYITKPVSMDRLKEILKRYL